MKVLKAVHKRASTSIRALAEGVLSNVENVPTSGNAKKLFCFFPIRRNEHSFQQRLLREQGTHIVHSHIA